MCFFSSSLIWIGRSVLCVREGGSLGSELERSWCQAVQDRSPAATRAGKIRFSVFDIITSVWLPRNRLMGKKDVPFFPSLIFLDILSIQTEATLSPTTKTQSVHRCMMIFHKRRKRV